MDAGSTMAPQSPRSPNLHSHKRARQSSPDKDSPTSLSPPTSDLLPDGAAGHGAGKVGQSSSFRNVSACNRCRSRKNRCDVRLPSCASCEKAGVACVGYDPITKREIPRSYIFYLESRIEQLESLLAANTIAFPPAADLEYSSKPSNGSNTARSPVDVVGATHPEAPGGAGGIRVQNEDDTSKLQRLVSKSSLAGVPGAANPRYLGAASGVSFARVVFAAVQSSVSDQKSTSDKGGIRPYRPIAGGAVVGAGTSMRDSFFGLHTKPTIHPAAFPDKALGLRLVTLYFEHANPQIPVLHRVDFMELFEQAYAEEGRVRGPRELYMLNMVFAIGGAIILGDGAKNDNTNAPSDGSSSASKQCQPEEYHASAIVHLEACLGSGGGLEELQAVLLLANFALLRPVPPGLWYIIGVAVRLAVDLGLHYEDGKDIEAGLGDTVAQHSEAHARERGRREYVRDLRRRLWWCTYSFDRLVSVCVGRPFGISDQVITTEFPSLLEDRYITQNGFIQPPLDTVEPTYKLVAYHYFRLRLLQSEILQVLQFQQAEIARAAGLNQKNPHMHTSLPSPFLSKFDSFRSWRIDIDKRLYEWKTSAPTKQETGVAFSPEFLDLNYWQAIIMLYRQSLSVPAMFEGEYHTAKEVNSPTVYNMELREDEDRVYLKVAEAGQKILRLYRKLHRVSLVNYTYLATHHLFMAGISYLYAIWHSPIVRSRLTVDEVDFTILAAKSVFTDLIDKCPPAEACRDAFDRTTKATIRMANQTGGFGQDLSGQGGGRGGPNKRSNSRDSIDYRLDWGSRSDTASSMSGHMHHPHRRQHQQRTSGEHNISARRSQFDVTSDVMSNYAHSVSSGASQLPTFQQQKGTGATAASYRLSGIPHVKTESDGGFSLMRNLPPQPRSNASSANDASARSPNESTAAGAAAIDPLLMPSPTAMVTPPAQQQQQQMASSPMSTVPPQLGGTGNSSMFAQQQQQYNSPTSFGDLQGIDFLQGLDSAGGAGGGGGGLDGGAGDMNMGDTLMDLGFGLGWEGMHHDFSEGQQGLDLFDGFFFGGQQGGGGTSGGL
ncbi:fungal-specific transcription factor domain-containing protein [Apodospora peruviana]|uniref:Fungal-specific transcription factor domain-containing protein n=1 Tax=Apodospora peruviana TaxID=516989 RepID=A0AAE0I4Z3_9PEZI|nr:fungal-specific transcription factor domain-containing protein [Apodospora peruviana]